jgi:hypothetical protein
MTVIKNKKIYTNINLKCQNDLNLLGFYDLSYFLTFSKIFSFTCRSRSFAKLWSANWIGDFAFARLRK